MKKLCTFVLCLLLLTTVFATSLAGSSLPTLLVEDTSYVQDVQLIVNYNDTYLENNEVVEVESGRYIGFYVSPAQYVNYVAYTWDDRSTFALKNSHCVIEIPKKFEVGSTHTLKVYVSIFNNNEYYEKNITLKVVERESIAEIDAPLLEAGYYSDNFKVFSMSNMPQNARLNLKFDFPEDIQEVSYYWDDKIENCEVCPIAKYATYLGGIHLTDVTDFKVGEDHTLTIVTTLTNGEIYAQTYFFRIVEKFEDYLSAGVVSNGELVSYNGVVYTDEELNMEMHTVSRDNTSHIEYAWRGLQNIKVLDYPAGEFYLSPEENIALFFHVDFFMRAVDGDKATEWLPIAFYNHK